MLWIERMKRCGEVCDWLVGVPPLSDLQWNQRWNRIYQATKEFDEWGDEICERLTVSAHRVGDQREER